MWPNSNTVIVSWLNRMQNISAVTTCNPQTGACSEVRYSSYFDLFDLTICNCLAKYYYAIACLLQISSAGITTPGGYVDFNYVRIRNLL